jgi:hypothetical protein
MSSAFEAPFMSPATFDRRKLASKWTIVGSRDGRHCSVADRDGQRDAHATMQLPDRKACRIATIHKGIAVRGMQDRKTDGELGMAAMCIAGHQLVNKLVNIPGTDKKIKKSMEARYLAVVASQSSPGVHWQLPFGKHLNAQESTERFYHDGELVLQGRAGGTRKGPVGRTDRARR